MMNESSRAAVERSLRWRFLAACFAGFIVLLSSAFAFAFKLVSRQAFVGIITVYMVSMFVALTAVILNARKKLRPFAPDLSKPPDAGEQQRLRRAVRNLSACELFFACALIYGLAQMRDEPWTAKIIPVAISLFIVQAPLIFGIVRARRRLKLVQNISTSATDNS